MAILKCKMCGGDLEISEEISVCECQYCGTRQTVPKVEDEKKLKLYERANKLRANCEFDKAATVYENIVSTYSEDAEGYWGLILCRYGIEYVDDPVTGKKIPTCHRSSFESIMDDVDFEMVMENSDATSRVVYRDEAKYIEEVRKGIIEVSGKEEPYDIFICYKETDEHGDRTLDSVLAQDVYDVLTQKGYRVFFSRITLESKLGVEYEPYIFAALNSAKVMLAFGTSYDYYNAVWVKNEWSRYLKLMAKDKSKHLIPCFKNLDAYDIPKEFAKLQSQDMGKIGAVQDLLRGIEKLLGGEEKVYTPKAESVVFNMNGGNGTAFIKRGYMSIEDGEWTKATDFFEQALNINAEDGQAYWGELLAQFKCKDMDELSQELCTKLSQDIEVGIQTVELPEWYENEKEKYVFFDVLDDNELKNIFLRFNYESKVPSIQKIINNNKENFVLNTNSLFQRAAKYANDMINSDIQDLKNKLDMLLNDILREAILEENNEFEKAEREASVYYVKLRNILEEANAVAISNVIKNEEAYKKELEEWQVEEEKYSLKYEQWERNIENYNMAYEQWKIVNKDLLVGWNEAKIKYAKAKEGLEKKKASLENEMLLIEGVFAKKKIASKEAEINLIREKIRDLTPPKKPVTKPEPIKPIKPVLRDKPELSPESKVGKSEVLAIINHLLKQEIE